MEDESWKYLSEHGVTHPQSPDPAFLRCFFPPASTASPWMRDVADGALQGARLPIMPIMVILGLYWGYVEILERKMEATIMGLWRA